MTAHAHSRHILIVARDVKSCAPLAVVSAKCRATVSQCVGRQDGLRAMQKKSWDVLLVDLDKDAAVETIRDARRIWPWQFCIALVGRGAVSEAVEMIRAGATDCLEKSASPRRLLSAIRQGLAFADTSLFGSGTPLTRTELTVLHLLLAGHVARDIAAHLGRSKRTIDAHRNNISRKLGASNCVGIVKWAMSTGLLDHELCRRASI